MLAAISDGESRVTNPLETGDCVSTRKILEALGVEIRPDAGGLVVGGRGLRGFKEPSSILDAENSGTLMRLFSGLLAGLPMFAVMTGDGSLRRRPMGRVVEPLRRMGARIEGREGGKGAPLCFLPGRGGLSAIAYDLDVASAQVKSAIILAALRGDGITRIKEKAGSSRDHTERLLTSLGADVRALGKVIEVSPASSLPAFTFQVPGDVSSASFFLAAAAITGGTLEVGGCGINPTRLGFISALRRMGAAIEVVEESSCLGEPIGTIRLAPAELSAVEVEPSEIPDLIDEVPLIAVLALFCRGRTMVKGAGELRHKESDRLEALGKLVESLGGRIELFPDGFAVEGPQALHTGVVDSFMDHRIAMAAAVAGAAIPGGVRVTGVEAARVSYPDFVKDYRSLGGCVE